MGRRFALLVSPLIVVAFATGAGSASAAVYVTACPEPPSSFEAPLPNDAAIETRFARQDAAATCAALAERIETMVGLIEAANESETTTAAQRVALAPADRNRLDLMWWGVWGTIGTLWVLIVSPMMWASFRWWRD